MKPCKKCGLVKDLSKFKTSSTKHGYYQTCKQCCNEATDPEKVAFYYWKSDIKRKYRLTPEDYYQMLKGQNGCCAICGIADPGAKKSYFCVDHCHHTGKVRGLLCSSCNIGIGNLKDSRTLLKNALKYLDGKPSSDDVFPTSFEIK